MSMPSLPVVDIDVFLSNASSSDRVQQECKKVGYDHIIVYSHMFILLLIMFHHNDRLQKHSLPMVHCSYTILVFLKRITVHSSICSRIISLSHRTR